MSGTVINVTVCKQILHNRSVNVLRLAHRLNYHIDTNTVPEFYDINVYQ